MWEGRGGEGGKPSDSHVRISVLTHLTPFFVVKTDDQNVQHGTVETL